MPPRDPPRFAPRRCEAGASASDLDLLGLVAVRDEDDPVNAGGDVGPQCATHSRTLPRMACSMVDPLHAATSHSVGSPWPKGVSVSPRILRSLFSKLVAVDSS